MPAPTKIEINQFRHPSYVAFSGEETKWRYCYLGGDLFKNRYLQKFSKREDNEDFATRREMSYCPMFAKQGIDEIRNLIFQRMPDIIRQSKTATYRECIQGNKGGVDLRGGSMNNFMGCSVLPELMVMGRVGVFIDMPAVTGTNLLETLQVRPYVYMYRAEQILNWSYDTVGNFKSLLLEDQEYDYDPISGLAKQYKTCYRFLWVEDGRVHFKFYDDKGDPSLREGTLGISRIPFYRGKLSSSLMQAVADHQIALLNTASSDIGYITTANFPFYVEQFSVQVEQLMHGLRQADNDDGESEGAQVADDHEVKVGQTKGRRYPEKLQAPSFIHPSPEPLMASMKKQEQIKEEIRSLLHLTLANLSPSRSSAESKQEDTSREENGLSYIGQEMEAIERFVAEIWSEFEGDKPEVYIKYPETYDIKPLSSRIETATKLTALMPKIPSETFRKEAAKTGILHLFSNILPTETLSQAIKEIDALSITLSDPEVINADLEAGTLDCETASKLRGYPDGTAEKAFEDKVEKAKIIAEAQSVASGKATENPAARGVPEASPPGQKARDEKKDLAGDRKPQRGKGK